MTVRDMKEALSSGRKVGVSHMRGAIKTYNSRACEWGEVRYERANFLRPASEDAPDSVAGVRAAFKRYRVYLEAADRHLTAILDEMEMHQALDPNLEDGAGMKRAAFAEDTDQDPKLGIASGLPHLCGLAASLNMASAQATAYGLLPKDPGQPWKSALDALRAREQSAIGALGNLDRCAHFTAIAGQCKCDEQCGCRMLDGPCCRLARAGGVIEFRHGARPSMSDGLDDDPTIDTGAPDMSEFVERPPCVKHPTRHWCASCDTPVDINPAGVVTCRLTQRVIS